MASLATEIDWLAPWVPAISLASKEPDIRFPAAGAEHPFILAGMLLRESEAGHGIGYAPTGSLTGWGDAGHAYSQWQFDHRDHDNMEWFKTPEAATRDGQVRRVVYYLREGRSMLAWALQGDILERAAVAAYNADARKVLRGALRDNPDEPTTDGNYSRWVFDKATALWTAKPELFG